MQYSSSEDAIDVRQRQCGEAAMEAQEAIAKATSESNAKMKTLAADIAKLVNGALAWGD